MRLIDADALLEGIAELKQSPWFNNKYGYADRKDAVESIEYLCIKKEPTVDAVEVVRCKDCKHWELCDEEDGISYGQCMHPLCVIANTVFLNENWYCADGERKENVD